MEQIKDLSEWKFPDVAKMHDGISTRERELQERVEELEAILTGKEESIKLLTEQVSQAEQREQDYARQLIVKVDEINNMMLTLNTEMKELVVTMVKLISEKIIGVEISTNPAIIEKMITNILHQQKVNGAVKVEVARDFLNLLANVQLDPAIVLEVNHSLKNGDMIISYLGKSWIYKIDYMIDQLLKEGR